MAKKAKRLTPKPETLRELFLKSGNQCAFPGCDARMMDKDGVFIGQLCHIEAAEDGGPRFNATMSDEDRRAFGNLMLMCYPHHKVTDEVKKYSVKRLQGMKAKHEAKFTNPEKKILQAIKDQTKAIPIHLPTSLKKMDSVLRWANTKRQRTVRVRLLKEMIEKVRRVPIGTRELLAVIVERSGGRSVRHHEIRDACELRDEDVYAHVMTLAKYELVQADYQEAPNAEISMGSLWTRREDLGCDGDWIFWEDLLAFCEKTGTELSEFVINLRFDLLD
jgi:hypothetical protein